MEKNSRSRESLRKDQVYLEEKKPEKKRERVAGARVTTPFCGIEESWTV